MALRRRGGGHTLVVVGRIDALTTPASPVPRIPPGAGLASTDAWPAPPHANRPSALPKVTASGRNRPILLNRAR